jgi:RecB family endonuclease NucS
MANLFWISKEATTRLVETSFRTEEEFERLIFATPEILEDIFLLKRQIRGGTKQGIPDIVGLDKDGNICIIEMKNVTVESAERTADSSPAIHRWAHMKLRTVSP